jgi:hypothetical protein
MSRLGKFVVAVSAIWFVVATAYFSHRSGLLGLLQLLMLPLFPCLFAAIIISFVCVFKEWRQRRWRSLLPLGICFVSIFISGVSVKIIRQAIFKWPLPSYEMVVQQMESGKIPVTAELNPIPEAKSEACLAYAVLAQKDTNGVLSVEFLTEVGFPVKHSGYLYSSSGIIEPRSLIDSRWPIRHQIKDKWFYISD